MVTLLLKMYTFYPHSACVSFVWLQEQTAITFLSITTVFLNDRTNENRPRRSRPNN
jgi:hypothetical protein